MGKIKTWLILMVCSYTIASAQLAPVNNTQNPKTRALNNYVYFVNESIHGMLIVHRLLENFNLNINKYVDLDSYQINFYSNQDLPRDIFDDPDNWFYEISPYEWYDRILEESGILDKELEGRLNADAVYIKETITALNQVRFKIEELISEQDLTDPGNLQKVYDELEGAAELYKNFYQAQKRIEKQLDMVGVNNSPYYENMRLLYRDFKNVLLAIRKQDKTSFPVMFKKLNTSATLFQNVKLPQTPWNKEDIAFHLDNIKSQIQKAVISSRRFLENQPPPREYEMYGAAYYYYNSDVINKFNRYGSGIVFEMNTVLDLLEAPELRLFELPHYYKVIYPRKLEKLTSLVTKTKPVNDIPLELEGRKLQKKEEGNILVDNQTIRVQVFDHMIQDGDIVSLNFNGKWVLRDHKLTSEPVELNLVLNSEGKNYLVLHAENLGARPPNTVALSYFAGGKKQMYVMNSDLNTSEVIEIVRN